MIGFFDSGVGGLTIEQEVAKRLPQYSRIYLGDGARSPYGEKTHDQLVEYSWQGIQWLFSQGAELVILACNSASASALREIQQTKLGPNPKKRVLGVIRPTVEELARRGFHDVAVLSTEATKKSEAYVHEFEKLDNSIHVTAQACPQWAPLVEQGRSGEKETRDVVRKDLDTLCDADPDVNAVLLACTHYPYLKEDVQAVLGPSVAVFDQGELVAASLVDYLERHPEIEKHLDRTKKVFYYTTGDEEVSTKIAQDAFGFDVQFKNMVLA